MTYLPDLRVPDGDLKGCVQPPLGVFHLRQPEQATVLVDDVGTAHVGLMAVTDPGSDIFI